MIQIEIVDLPEIAIIGREGLCTAENHVVASLWEQANSHFGEVADLGMREADGSYTGFWGAMSDCSMSFLPWEDGFTKGMYLAGIETTKDAPVPAGWTKWVLPARRYLVADVDKAHYGEIFSEVIEKVIPEKGYVLAGAVCDYTKPANGQNKLFFPVCRA